MMSRYFFVGLLLIGLFIYMPVGLTAPAITGVLPDTLQRGHTQTLVIEGMELGDAVGVEISSEGQEMPERVATEAFVWVSDEAGERLEVEVVLGDRALSGARTIIVEFDGVDSDITLAGAFSVVAGPPSLSSVEPVQVMRGAGDTVTLRGRNLDSVTSVGVPDGPEGLSAMMFLPDVDNPTRATLVVSASQAVSARAYDLTIENADAEQDRLVEAFSIVPGAVHVESLSPSAVARGDSEVVLTASGQNLDAVERIQLGTGISVDNMVASSPETLVVTVSVLEQSAPAGVARGVTFLASDESFELEEALTVEAGTPELTRLRPDRLSQGSRTEVTFEGINLDGVDTITLAEGISAEMIELLSPVRFLATLVVAEDAGLGFQDVTVSGEFGEAARPDALLVLERIEPRIQVNFPDVRDFGLVQVGARKRVNLTFVNENDSPEVVSLEVTMGDINDFALVDPAGLTLETANPEVLRIELASREERPVTIEFRPAIRSTLSAGVEVSAREVVIGTIQLRGEGDVPNLRFVPEPPLSIGTVAEGELAVAQVSTLQDGVERIVIEGFEVLVEQNNSPFPEAQSLTDVRFSEPLAPEEAYLFGTTLVFLELRYPIGSYQGELLLSTDWPTAPLVPYPFSVSVQVGPAGGDAGDVGPNADVGPALDAGGDTGAGLRDVGTPDLSRPETDMGADAAAGDMGTEPPTEEMPPPDEGCCQTAYQGRPRALHLVFAALGLALVSARRRRGHV